MKTNIFVIAFQQISNLLKVKSTLLFTHVFTLALALVLMLVYSGGLKAQQGGDAGRFQSIEDLTEELNRISGRPDESMRKAAVRALLEQLEAEGNIPYREQERALFLFSGNAGEIHFRGDFNGWGNGDEDAGAGRRIDGTDVWVHEIELPCDARVDYKIVRDGTEWLLDPYNERQQWGGAGPNSELAMPCYEVPEETVTRYDIPQGTISQPYTYSSQELGYEVTFYVYLPHDYIETRAHPVVYVTDGHEYADENMGRMITVLDNAIADSLIPPVMAIFIDPRDPYSGENRRMNEFQMNRRYANFLAGELVPGIDEMFATSAYDGDRALMGTSLGGVNTAYLALTFPQVFGRAAMHSPAFGRVPELLDAFRQSRRQPVSMYISAGTINDGLEQAHEFRDILFDQAWHMEFEEINQGHSWGQWKGQILPALLFFWGGVD
jgi:enterochelin esterase-like enzyme